MAVVSCSFNCASSFMVVVVLCVQDTKVLIFFLKSKVSKVWKVLMREVRRGGDGRSECGGR